MAEAAAAAAAVVVTVVLAAASALVLAVVSVAYLVAVTKTARAIKQSRPGNTSKCLP